MTVLSETFNAANLAHVYPVRGRVYLTNDFDAHTRIDPQAAVAYPSAISGPTGAIGAPSSSAAGNITAGGTHLIRYRYKDPVTLYVSNPSDAAEITGLGQVTYNIGAMSPIVPSTDARVSLILIEMTPVNSPEYYVAAEVANDAGSVVINIPDRELVQQVAVSARWGGVDDLDSFSHNPPPVSAFGFEAQGYHFVGGTHDHSVSATFVNASKAVTFATAISPYWVGRQLLASCGTRPYTLATIAADGLSGTLLEAWEDAGATVTVSVVSPDMNRICWSLPLYLESFDTTRRSREVLAGRADRLSGGWFFRGAVYLFGRTSTDILTYTVSPAVGDGRITPMMGHRGVYNQRCLVEASGRLFAWDNQGIWEIRSGAPVPLSAPIDPLLEQFADGSTTDRWHAAYDPFDDQVLFWFVPVGGTEPNIAAVLDLATGNWQFMQWVQALTGSAFARFGDGEVALVVTDVNGYTWAQNCHDYQDGGPADTPNYATVVSAASPTSVVVAQTLPTSPNLMGATVYNIDRNQSAVIASNTADTLTLAGAGLATQPAAGETLVIGMVPWEYRFKWAEVAATQKMRPAYFAVTGYPGEQQGNLQFSFFGNFDSGTPLQYTSFGASSVYPDGVRISDGLDYCTLDTDYGSADGYAPIPIPTGWQRVLQARLRCFIQDEVLVIRDAKYHTMDGEVVGAIQE